MTEREWQQQVKMQEYLDGYREEPPKRKVYVCSQYGSRGDRSTNLELAKAFTQAVIDEGSVPICPHLFLHDVLDDEIPSQRAAGMMIGLEMMRDCDEVRIFTRISKGMVNEILLADEMHIPVNIANLRCVAMPGGAERTEKEIAADLEELRNGKEHYPEAY